METFKLQTMTLINNVVFLLFVGALIDTAGDLLMKKWVETQSWQFFIVGMVFYLVGLSCLAFSFNFKNIAVASIIFVLLNIVLLSLAGWIFYGETLKTKEFFGILLGLMAVFLIES
ncbi:SMR family transporter [Cecembia sp.]|uniref:SMR family transporter n=1 Tax=Cecembia sp. TaxID=1898110 RepID=UPI0025BE1406|nr:SMR family transporter [Cecembia sp.]